MNEIFENLRNTPIFENLPKAELKKIVNAGSVIKYKKDDIILVEEEEGSSLFFILEGRVKIVKTSEEGKEVILNVLEKNEFFGEMSVLDGYTRSATVVAMEITELFLLKRKDFLNLLAEHPEISILLIKIISIRLRRANLKIKALSLGDSEKKVGAVILQLALDHGKPDGAAIKICEMPIQQEIAKMAGTSRETVSRIMNLFVKRKLIEYQEDCVRILDFQKFRESYK